MTFQKIPKEEWFKMSQEEKDYHTLEFQKSVEKRKKLILISTRILALIFIGVLFYIGYVQFQSAKIYDEKLKEYGKYGFCALCGEYNLKRCECSYAKTVDYGNFRVDVNYSQIGQELAEFNTQSCEPYDIFIKKKMDQIANGTIVGTELSK